MDLTPKDHKGLVTAKLSIKEILEKQIFTAQLEIAMVAIFGVP